mmetsp:Transcript_32822/g.36750  ORF Transcript_32822/g.36750 Transcript_32822/m.36750 type:complete len:92 (-) Transcript_32822:166-441(-)
MYEVFRVTLHTNPPTDMNDANQYMDNVLGAWIHDRYAICSQQNYVNSPLCIDIQLRYDNGRSVDREPGDYRDKRQYLINENLTKQNKERIE